MTLTEDELIHISEIGLVEWHKRTEGEGRPLYSDLIQYLDYSHSNLTIKAQQAAKAERVFANQCLADLHDTNIALKEADQKIAGLTVELQFIKDKTAPMYEECKAWASALKKWSPFYMERMHEMKRAIELYETGDFIKYHNDEWSKIERDSHG